MSLIALIALENSIIMVLSEKDKIIIENDYLENGWTAYKICQEHQAKHWVLSSVQRLIQKIKETGSIKRRKGSGRPVTACTPEKRLSAKLSTQPTKQQILLQREKLGSSIAKALC